MRIPALGLFLFLTIAVSSRAEDPAGISEAAAKARAGRMMTVIDGWEKVTGLQVVYDTATFWKKLSPKGTFDTLAAYIKLEDGVKEPLRTGREVALFNRIKAFHGARKEGTTLGMDDLLLLGLESAVPVERTVNLQEVILTVHNVIRLLARPQQWSGAGMEGDFGHPPTDPAWPILQDLRGLQATEGRTLAEVCGVKRKPDGEVVDASWSLSILFDLKAGIFQPQPGAKETLWNGGCHYYFWVGALARTVLGPAAVMGGMVAELRAKKDTGDGEQGVVQVSSFTAGSMFGSDAFSMRDRLLGWFDGQWVGTMTLTSERGSKDYSQGIEFIPAEGDFRGVTLDPKTMKPDAGKKDSLLTFKREGEGEEEKLWLEVHSGGWVQKFHLEKPGTIRIEGENNSGKTVMKCSGVLKRAEAAK